MLCCDTSYNLGCFGRCEDITTGLVAAVTGTYQVVYMIANGVFRQNVDFTIGENITFESMFNENYISVFSILDPLGNYLTIDGEQCFQVTIR